MKQEIILVVDDDEYCATFDIKAEIDEALRDAGIPARVKQGE